MTSRPRVNRRQHPWLYLWPALIAACPHWPTPSSIHVRVDKTDRLSRHINLDHLHCCEADDGTDIMACPATVMPEGEIVGYVIDGTWFYSRK